MMETRSWRAPTRWIPTATSCWVLISVGCGSSGGNGGDEGVVAIDVQDASFRVDEDGSLVIDLPATSETVDTDAMTFTIVDPPGLGTLEGSGSSWTYTPAPDVSGDDSFSWTAEAGGVVSAIAQAAVYVVPTNDAPTAEHLVLGTIEDTPVAARLEALDVDGDALTWLLHTVPAHGVATLNPSSGELLYTPDTDYAGSDTLWWSAQDPGGGSTGPRSVQITISGAGDPPVVDPSGLTVQEDQVGSGVLTGRDPDGDALVWRIHSNVLHGTLNLDSNVGSFTYRPDEDYFGPDAFEVVASDGGSDSQPALVSIVVTAVNDPPTLISRVFQTPEDTPLIDVLTADDPEGNPLTWIVGGFPAHGSLLLQPDGSFTYSPALGFAGIDAFTVVVADPFDVAPPAQVTVEVVGTNDPPTILPALVITDEDESVAGQLVGSDPDGDALLYAVSEPPLLGQVELDVLSGQFVYRPDPDANGQDSFLVRASDGVLNSPDAVVDVVIYPINDAPRPPVVTLEVLQDGQASIDLAAYDAEGDDLLYLVLDAPTQGESQLNADTGRFDYRPDAGFYGNDQLVYRVSDGAALVTAVLPIVVQRDRDGDGVPDDDDNCRKDPNADQADANDNGIGDVCDCREEFFSDPLNDAVWAVMDEVEVDADAFVSAPVSVRLNGVGAVFATHPFVSGCGSTSWSFELKRSAPSPEPGDAIVLQAREVGGPWIDLHTEVGTGAEDPVFSQIVGNTIGLPLTGDMLEWRFIVFADAPGDDWLIDDFRTACDTDADLLPDCKEAEIGWDPSEGDADGDGLLDGEELDLGSNPNLADSDGDGVDDPDDNCPVSPNPDQADDDGNGVGDLCEFFIFENFSDGDIDLTLWEGMFGNARVQSTYYVSVGHALKLTSEDSDITSLRFDLRGCPAIAADLFMKRGPDAPDPADFLWFEAQSGQEAWDILEEVEGDGGVAPFRQQLWTSRSPAALSGNTRYRLRSAGNQFNDSWYIDNIMIGCDEDEDGLPSLAEAQRYGTNPGDPDTDGDGVDDGVEVLAGTDPTDPYDF